MWALLLIATLSVGVPSVLNVFSLGTLGAAVGEPGGGLIAPAVDSALWASFWSILAAFFTAGIGGAIGGLFARNSDFYEPVREYETEEYYAEEEDVTRAADASPPSVVAVEPSARRSAKGAAGLTGPAALSCSGLFRRLDVSPSRPAGRGRRPRGTARAAWRRTRGDREASCS